nr:TPA_asm: NADH dehydrogenase subunit 2 [Pseudomyrmex ferrugineus]
MNLFSSLIIMPSMILTAVVTITMTNLLSIWFIMEVTNFMFIVYMMFNMKQKKMVFLYFIVQVMASFIFLFSFIINPVNFILDVQVMIFIALFMKTGIPPFHLWMPLTSKFMPWMMIFFMLTLQKIPQLIMFFLVNMPESVFTLLILMTLIVPPAIMINLKSIKMLITYSSINQTGWIIALIFLKHQSWFIYFMTYTTIMLMITSMLSYTEISNKFFQYMFKKFNFMFTMMMMNLASMPPFSFFMFKWFSTFMLIVSSNLKVMIMTMLINSLLMTFIYIKMMMWSLFINKFEHKMIFTNLYMMNPWKLMWVLVSIMSPLIMMM